MRIITCLLFLLLIAGIAFSQQASVVENVIVIKEKDRFGGWPANNGIWSWGDEIVVGFTWGYHDDEKEGGHPIRNDKPSVKRQARSVDGGKTWTIEKPSYLDENEKEPKLVECPGGINFAHKDFALMFVMEGSNAGFSRWFYSYDRCKTWNGPYRLPGFGRKGVFARTDYIINGPNDLFAFFTAAEDWGGEGWPFCARTTDGGKSWQFQGWIGEQPEQAGYSIMPSTLRLDNGALFSMIRRRSVIDGKKMWFIEPFLSPDDGHSWYLLKAPFINNAGNPPSMIRLKDGRIALTYGWRTAPYGVRAIISDDEAKTWSNEIILRDDGKSWDLGYPRTVQRSDGKCVTAYYFNDDSSKERYIAATIWDPGEKK